MVESESLDDGDDVVAARDTENEAREQKFICLQLDG